MIVNNFILLICCSLTITGIICAPDYYWRDFDGTIPDDAYLAVFDGAERTYVGNVQIFEGGLYVGELKSGTPNITVNGYDLGGVRTVSKNIKILCTKHPNNFYWTPTDSSALLDIPDHLVVGGWERAIYGINYIGRSIIQNVLRVGKIVGFDDSLGHLLYVPVDGSESSFTQYEVLIYRE